MAAKKKAVKKVSKPKAEKALSNAELTAQITKIKAQLKKRKLWDL